MRAYKSCPIEERSKGVKCAAMQAHVNRQIELLFTACSSPVSAKPFCSRHRPRGIGEGQTIFVGMRRSDRTSKFTCRHADQ
jgi:hypothetical protein